VPPRSPISAGQCAIVAGGLREQVYSLAFADAKAVRPLAPPEGGWLAGSARPAQGRKASPMSHSIGRIAKMNVAAAGSADKHDQRLRTTPNADPARTPLNRLVMGVDGPLPQTLQGRLAEVAQEVGADSLVKRKDAVTCMEVLLTASPEYFRPENPTAAGTWNPDNLVAFERVAVKFLGEEFGPRNVIRARLHLDEATPHIHAYVTPITTTDEGEATRLGVKLVAAEDPKDRHKPKLNARAWVGGRQRLSAFQDRLGEAFLELGLERGVRGSKRHHQAVSQFYTQQATREAELSAATSAIEWQHQNLHAQIAAADATLAAAEKREAEAEAKAAELAERERKLEESKRAWDDERTKRLRTYVRNEISAQEAGALLMAERKTTALVHLMPHPSPDHGPYWIDRRTQKVAKNSVDVLRAELGPKEADAWMIKRFGAQVREASSDGVLDEIAAREKAGPQIRRERDRGPTRGY